MLHLSESVDVPTGCVDATLFPDSQYFDNHFFIIYNGE